MKPQHVLAANHVLDRELYEICVRLGEAVLVPIDEDGRLLAQPKSFSDTQQKAYLQKLAESDVAVVLGPASDHLYAVVFTNPEAAMAFADANPVAHETTVLDGFGQTAVFFRMEGFAPPSIQWGDGEWLGPGKCFPVRIKGAQSKPEWLTDYTPARIKFADLVWPQAVQALFTRALVEVRYGRPFYPGCKRSELNFAYWACYYSLENQVRYCQERGEFYRLDRERAGWESLSRGVIESSILEFLLAQGRQVGCEVLQRPLDAAARKTFLGELKVVALGQVFGLEQGLKLFISEGLEKFPGSNISVRELYVLYCQFCRISKPAHSIGGTIPAIECPADPTPIPS